jgi:hypothetical protein
MCAANYCVHISCFLLQLPLPGVWSVAMYSFWVAVMLQNVDGTVLWLVVFVSMGISFESISSGVC